MIEFQKIKVRLKEIGTVTASYPPQFQEVCRHGGVNLTDPMCDALYDHFRAKYRKFYLWWVIDPENPSASRLHVAHVSDFDRWANSRVYYGPIPETFADLNRLLTRLEGGRVRGRAMYTAHYDDKGWFNIYDNNYNVLRRTRCYPYGNTSRCPVQHGPHKRVNCTP